MAHDVECDCTGNAETVMQMSKHWKLISILFAGVAAQGYAPASLSQSYPAKPVHIVIGYPPGGGTDATARLISQKLSEHVGQPVVVENRPGASGLIAIEKVAQSAPDGYTLVLIASSSILAHALSPVPSFDFERDLAPISLATVQPFVLLVNPVLPVRTVKDLVALAHRQPGKLNYGSSGVGGASHLAGELFHLLAKVKLVHVPYKGGGESVVAVAAGQIELTFASSTSALPLLTSGKLRALGVTTPKRTSLLPADVPTLAESGVPGYDHVVWYAILGRTGMPGDMVTRLNSTLAKIVNTSEMKESFRRQGLEAQTNTPPQLAALVRAEFVKNANLIKAANLKSE